MYKFIYKYQYDARQLTDIVRTSFIFNDVAKLWKAVKTIDEKFASWQCGPSPECRGSEIQTEAGSPHTCSSCEKDWNVKEDKKITTGGVVSMKDRLTVAPASGYSDVLLNVKYQGIVCEIQLHLKKFMDLKGGDNGMHAAYKKARHFGEDFEKFCYEG